MFHSETPEIRNHNPEVAGSNPAPATISRDFKNIVGLKRLDLREAASGAAHCELRAMIADTAGRGGVDQPIGAPFQRATKSESIGT